MKKEELSDTTFYDISNKQKSLNDKSLEITKSELDTILSIKIADLKRTVFLMSHAPSIEKRTSALIDPVKASDFFTFKENWKKESSAQSSPFAIRMNRNYQKIIGLGDSIIPLILRELKKQPDDWLYALEMIVRDEEQPTTKKMGFNESISAWIKWGEEKGII